MSPRLVAAISGIGVIALIAGGIFLAIPAVDPPAPDPSSPTAAQTAGSVEQPGQTTGPEDAATPESQPKKASAVNKTAGLPTEVNIPDREGTLAPRLEPTEEGVNAGELMALPKPGVTADQIEELAKGLPGQVEILANPGKDDRGRVVKFGVLPEDSADIAAALVESDLFEAVDYNATVKAAYSDTPNDLDPDRQWGMMPYPGANFRAAWPMLDQVAGPQAAPIALIDTGFDLDHPDKGPNVVAGYDFIDDTAEVADYAGHGTQMGGLMAANTDNGIGLAGATWDAKVITYRVGDVTLELEAIVNAIYDAVDQGAKVISMSFGSETPDALIHRALDYAWSRGVVLVGAAGNAGVVVYGQDPQPNYPGAYLPVVNVGGRDALGNHDVLTLAYEGIDLAAPSAGQWSLSVGGGTIETSGTSAATAMASSAASLVRRANPELSATEVKQVLFDSARDVGPVGVDDESGYGMVDAAAAIALAKKTTPSGEHHVMITNPKTELNPVVSPGEYVGVQLTSVVEGDSDPEFSYAVTLPDGSPVPAGVELSEGGLLTFAVADDSAPGDTLEFKVTVTVPGAVSDSVVVTAVTSVGQFEVSLDESPIVAKVGQQTSYSIGITGPAADEVDVAAVFGGDDQCVSVERERFGGVESLSLTVNCDHPFGGRLTLRATYRATGEKTSSEPVDVIVSRSGRQLQGVERQRRVRSDPISGASVEVAEGEHLVCSEAYGDVTWDWWGVFANGCAVSLFADAGDSQFGNIATWERPVFVLVQDESTGDATLAEITFVGTMADDRTTQNIDVRPGGTAIVDSPGEVTPETHAVAAWLWADGVAGSSWGETPGDLPEWATLTDNGQLVLQVPEETPADMYYYFVSLVEVDRVTGAVHYHRAYVNPQEWVESSVVFEPADPVPAGESVTLTAKLDPPVGLDPAGLAVTFTTYGRARVISADEHTDADGKAKVTIASPDPGTVAVAAVVDIGIESTGATTATFTGERPQPFKGILDADTYNRIADGKSGYPVTLQVWDSGGTPIEIPVDEVEFSATGAECTALSRLESTKVGTFCSANTPGLAIVNATWAGHLLEVFPLQLEFVQVPEYMYLVMDREVSGPGRYTVTAAVPGPVEPLRNLRVELSSPSPEVTILSPAVQVQTPWEYTTFTVQLDGPADVTLRARLVDAEGYEASETYRVPSSWASRVEVTLPGEDSDLVVVKVLDAAGKPVQNAEVGLWIVDASGNAVWVEGVTDADGLFTTEASFEQTKSVQVEVRAANFIQVYELHPDRRFSAELSSLEVTDAADVWADGVSSQTATLALRDEAGNPITDVIMSGAPRQLCYGRCVEIVPNSDGVFTAPVTAIKAGEVTVGAVDVLPSLPNGGGPSGYVGPYTLAATTHFTEPPADQRPVFTVTADRTRAGVGETIQLAFVFAAANGSALGGWGEVMLESEDLWVFYNLDMGETGKVISVTREKAEKVTVNATAWGQSVFAGLPLELTFSDEPTPDPTTPTPGPTTPSPDPEPIPDPTTPAPKPTTASPLPDPDPEPTTPAPVPTTASPVPTPTEPSPTPTELDIEAPEPPTLLGLTTERAWGLAEAGGTVVATVNGDEYQAVVSDGSGFAVQQGSWSVSFDEPLAEGTEVSFQAFDAAGNGSEIIMAVVLPTETPSPSTTTTVVKTGGAPVSSPWAWLLLLGIATGSASLVVRRKRIRR
jgi:hypothetical protein